VTRAWTRVPFDGRPSSPSTKPVTVALVPRRSSKTSGWEWLARVLPSAAATIPFCAVAAT
jgi:hypothetical protein